MNIYKLWNTNDLDYDVYRSAIVVAANEEDARLIHPYYGYKGFWLNDPAKGVWYKHKECYNYSWCAPSKVEVELIGVADTKYTEPTVIDYNNIGC